MSENGQSTDDPPEYAHHQEALMPTIGGGRQDPSPPLSDYGAFGLRLMLSIPGLVSRPVGSCDVTMSSSQHDEVELSFGGPDGPVTLKGNLREIYRLVVGLELALRDFVVEPAPPDRETAEPDRW